MNLSENTGQGAEPKLDPATPQSARVWNYWLGGNDNYASDRQLGKQIRAVNPRITRIAAAQRAFLVRTVAYLASQAGVRQFLDIGAGLPDVTNTHEVAQSIMPRSRIVYVDNDPLVMAHARALLVGDRRGRTGHVEADVRDPDRIVREAAETVDFDRPVAVMMLGITGHITCDDEAFTVVRRLLEPLCAGSYLVLCDSTDVLEPEAMSKAVRLWNADCKEPRVNRTPAVLAGFFDGLELLEPGIVSVTRWRPDPDCGEVHELDDHGGIGRKP